MRVSGRWIVVSSNLDIGYYWVKMDQKLILVKRFIPQLFLGFFTWVISINTKTILT